MALRQREVKGQITKACLAISLLNTQFKPFTFFSTSIINFFFKFEIHFNAC